MKNVLITRQPNQAVDFINLLSHNGFNPFILPMIETIPIKHVPDQQSYDYIIFTSMNSIRYFMKHYKDYSFKKIISIGDMTSKYLKQFDLNANYTPKTYSAQGLVELLKEMPIASKRFFIPGPKKRNKLLGTYLIENGAHVDEPIIYETKPVLYKKGEIEFFLTKHMIDVITFASPSSAEAFISQIEVTPDNIEFISIGTTTYSYLKEKNIQSIYPEDFTIEGIMDIIMQKFKH